MLEKEDRGLEVGPAICDYDGVMMPRATVNGILHECLKKLQLMRPDLIPLEMVDVYNETSIHRGAR